jgi:hypothetical protein
VRTIIALENFWVWLTGNTLRAFVHSPERMGAVLEAAGLVRATRREAFLWTLDLYRRGNANWHAIEVQKTCSAGAVG